MQLVGYLEGQVPFFSAMQSVAAQPVTIEELKRFAVHKAANKSLAIVRTSDPGPYGCSILSKSVI